MGNSEQQILSEIRQAIDTMRAQLDALEEMAARLAVREEVVLTEVADDSAAEGALADVEDDAIDIEDVLGIETAAEVVAEAEVLEDVAEVEEAAAEEVVAEEVAETADAEEVVEVEEKADAAGVEEAAAEEVAPESILDAAMDSVRPAVIDAMTSRETWRTDIPGSPVKDIRSAISLHDRIIFINGLFDEDPMLFQSVLTKVNSMTSLEEVVEYIREERPLWDMESDEVYRFMMAVRRRIQ